MTGRTVIARLVGWPQCIVLCSSRAYAVYGEDDSVCSEHGKSKADTYVGTHVLSLWGWQQPTSVSHNVSSMCTGHVLNFVQHTWTMGKLHWTCVLRLFAAPIIVGMHVQELVRGSTAISKICCDEDIPSATDTPQGSCLGPKDSHSIAESAPGWVWLSRRTVPAGPHRLCKHKELDMNRVVEADTNAEIVGKPAVVYKYNGIV